MDGRSSRMIGAAVAIVCLCAGAGCSHQVSGSATPGSNLLARRTFYVVDTRKADVAGALVRELKARGYAVSSGPREAMPRGTDCEVEFMDKWQWDLLPYLTEVRVDLLDPETGAVLGSGRFQRGSASRASADTMVREVLDKVFGPTGKKKAGA